jgi:hypothetical protein
MTGCALLMSGVAKSGAYALVVPTPTPWERGFTALTASLTWTAT